MSTSSIHPNDFILNDVGRHVRVYFRDETDVRGTLRKFDHDISWVEVSRLGEPGLAYHPGPVVTEFEVGSAVLRAVSSDGTMVVFTDVASQPTKPLREPVLD